MAKKPRELKVYRAYVFKDKDPAIGEVRALAETFYGGKINGKSLGNINRAGGPSYTCMRNWFFGDTRRPQNATMEAAGRAMGFRRVWQKIPDKGK